MINWNRGVKTVFKSFMYHVLPDTNEMVTTLAYEALLVGLPVLFVKLHCDQAIRNFCPFMVRRKKFSSQYVC